MSQQAENNFRLALYRELDEIVSAMKNLAQVESHRVGKAEIVQQAAWQTTLQAFANLQAQHPTPEQKASGRRVILLIGSERGFCGGFNEQIARAFRQFNVTGEQVMVVGSRLVNKLPDVAVDHYSTGASTAVEVLPCMHSIMDLLLQQPMPASLQVLSHGQQEAEWTPLLPTPTLPLPASTHSLQIQLPPASLRAELQWQSLQQCLLRLLLTSLRIENRYRLQQMDGAKDHLEELTQALRLRINTLRQQEIVEEIEVILANQKWG